jgi:hypothetical protein
VSRSFKYEQYRIRGGVKKEIEDIKYKLEHKKPKSKK